MKKRMSGILAVLMSLLVLISSIIPVYADTLNPTITIDSKQAVKGSNVSTKLTVSNNPGIAAATFKIIYDGSILKLNSVDFNTEFGGDFDELGSLALPVADSDTLKAVQISWSSMSNIAQNGTFLTMNFTVSSDAKKDSGADIKVISNSGDFCDIDENDVDFSTVSGTIKIVEGIPGDINGDRVVNSKDLIRLRKYFTGWDVDVDILACDCNGDDNVNSKDLIRLRKYFSGWDVELFYGSNSTAVCKHNLIKTNAKSKTCTEDGNREYWTCSICKKIYSDANALSEITLNSTVLKAEGHTVVIDAAVEPTYDSTGLTEGSHCSVCKTTLKKQNVIPKLKKTEYAITYYISNGDEYLAQQTIQNNNPATYTSEQGVSRFTSPSVPGYKFLGWYDLPSGDAAENIKSIPAGTTGNIDLYARWEKESYKINFSSDLIPVSSINYTVDEGAVLPSPKLDGYIFAGWSDDNGDIIKNITVGVTGSKTYKANWVSERNLAWSKTKLDDPMIFEDDQTNTILFIYEIGEIRNVPLYVVEDFGKINSDGVTKTVTKEIQRTTSTSEMQKYTTTVSKATTDSFGMTLSNGWTDSTTISKEWCEENGLKKEEGETIAKSDTSGWYVSSGKYGSDTDVTLDTNDEYKLNTATKNTKTYNSEDTEKRQDFSAGLNVNYKQTVGASVGFGDGMGIEGKRELGIGADLKYSNGKTTTKHTGNDKDEGSSDQTGDIKHTGTTHTHAGGWNNESGSSGSSTVSNTKSLLQTVTKKVSEKTGYGNSYIKTGSDSSSQGFSSTNSDTEEYSNTVTYSTEVSEKETVSYTTSNTRSGYHRWIYAGTAHVFGVVGYDIATSSYFVNTISIMDDETHPYEDYSYSYASYDDNQSTYIKFEIPNDIEEYVAGRVCKSDGLEINNEGVVTGYNGTDDYVLIPEYNVVDNLDGTTTVNKVVGFTSDAFKNNTKIYGVELSDFITGIPDYGFYGCTALDTVAGNMITSVGTKAFANCTSLKVCGIGDDVTYLGDKAFENLNYMVVNASNNQVLNAATNSGAKKITIYAAVEAKPFENIEIDIPDTCERFKFNGMGKIFSNFVINSDAKETIINRATFNSDAKIPVVINSPKIGLYQLTVNSKGIGLALKSDNSNIDLYGSVSINSEGQNSLLSKSFTLNKLKSNFTSLLKTNHDILCCGEVVDNGLLNCGGSIVKITEDEFNAQLKGVYNISFNTNGANTQLDDKTVYYGAEIGELPTPTKDYYTFDGWYTAKDGGDKVTESTIFVQSENITLYAHWEQKPTSGWVLASELPANAKAVEEKWTYDETTKITSDKSEVEGYTLYDTTSEWGEYGEWSAWSFNAVSASESRQVEKKSVHTGYYMDTYNTMSTGGARQFRSFSIDGKFSSYGCSSSYGEYHKSTTMTLSEANSVPKVAEGAYASNCSFPGYNKGNGTGYILTWEDGGTYVFFISGNVYNPNYRYRDRKLVYTYWLSKTEAKESTSEVEVSESISNVQKWVKYIEK